MGGSASGRYSSTDYLRRQMIFGMQSEPDLTDETVRANAYAAQQRNLIGRTRKSTFQFSAKKLMGGTL